MSAFSTTLSSGHLYKKPFNESKQLWTPQHVKKKKLGINMNMKKSENLVHIGQSDAKASC